MQQMSDPRNLISKQAETIVKSINVSHKSKFLSKFHNWGNKLVIPQAGESLLSVLLRQSWEFNIDLDRLMNSEQGYWRRYKSWNIRMWKELPLWIEKIDVVPLKPYYDYILQYRGFDPKLKELQCDVSRWIDFSVKKYHYKTYLQHCVNFDLQYSSICWKEADIRYFKKNWRLKYVVYCAKHGIKLNSNCSKCGSYLFENISKLKKIDFRKCQHCNHEISQNTPIQGNGLANLQQEIINNVESDKVDHLNANTAFGIPYDMIDDKFMNLLENEFNYRTVFGFEVAKYELHQFYQRNNRIPTTSDENMSLIGHMLRTKEVKQLGITTWNRLLKFMFGEINFNTTKYVGKSGLNNSIKQLEEFYNDHDRIPTSMEMKNISSAAVKGTWKEFRILTWNDLLRSVFGEVNRKTKIYQRIEGLKNAEKRLLKLFDRKGKLPKVTDNEINDIVTAIGRGHFSKWGIDSWNDILVKLFGEVNIDLNKYKGKKGLETAKKILQNFQENNNRLPTSEDPEMRGIVSAISNYKHWKDFGINAWNDLMQSVFGEINLERHIWEGKSGLDRAIDILTDIKAKTGELPTSKDSKANKIYSVVARKLWSEFGIDTWNDLLKKVFGDVNHEKNIHKGKEGLERAKSHLISYEKQTGEIPTSKQFKGIVAAIYEGYWEKFGVSKWNDLVKMTFGRIKNGKNIYKNRKALLEAKETLRSYYLRNNQKPKITNFRKIKYAINRGYWVKFGIESWEDMIEYSLKNKKFKLTE